MVIKGKLITAKREVKKFGKRETEEKLFITLAEATISDEQMNEIKEAFKDSGKQFTPDWVKDFKGYVNVSTQFELPYKDVTGEEFDSIEAGISGGLKWFGAECGLAINVKEGAIYPKAIKFYSEGSAPNPFADFDDEE